MIDLQHNSDGHDDHKQTARKRVDVKSLLAAMHDNKQIVADDISAMDDYPTPPHSSLDSSTGSPCSSSMSDSMGPPSPLFQDNLSPGGEMC